MSAEPLPILLAWSSGKDSAWALHELRARTDVTVAALLTTVNLTHERVAMHAVRRELLGAQAAAAGLPLWEVPIPSPCTDAQYERAMAAAMERARAEGLGGVAFGDLFLEDVRAYREEKLAGTGLAALFPLWGRPTGELARTMLAAGVKATITCVDPEQVPPELVGRAWDGALLDALPAGADPCGENGEFHTFVWDGPMLAGPLGVRTGPVLERDGFAFADLLPAD